MRTTIILLLLLLGIQSTAQNTALFQFDSVQYMPNKPEDQKWKFWDRYNLLFQTRITHFSNKISDSVQAEVSVSKTKYFSFSMKYFPGNDSIDLNEAAEKSSVLMYTYIDSLDLNKYKTNRWNQNQDSLFINVPLLFNHCVINKIISITSSKQVTVVFTKPVFFYSCSVPPCLFKYFCFRDDLVLINNNMSLDSDYVGIHENILGPQFQIDSSCFGGNVYLYNNIEDEYPIFDNIGKRKSSQEEIMGISKVYSVFYRNINSDSVNTVPDQVLSISNNCRFFKKLFIYNNNPYKIIYLTDNKFNDRVYIKLYYKGEIPLFKKYISDNYKQLPGSNQIKLIRSNLNNIYNCNLENGVFYNGADFSNSYCKNFNLYRSFFRDSLNLSNTKFDSVNIFHLGSLAFNKSLFNSCTIIEQEDGPDLDNLKINSQSFAEILFVTPAMSKNDSASYTISKNFFNVLKLSINQHFKDDKDNRDEISAKALHDEIMYDQEYDKKNKRFVNRSFIKYYTSVWLEKLVGNGYHGAFRFINSSLWFYMLFIFIYLLFFHRTIRQIMEENFKTNPDNQSKNKLSLFFYSAWFSFLVLINPRIQLKYLKYSIIFTCFVLLEWAIGIILLILFLYYIAPTYPFIKTLLGL